MARTYAVRLGGQQGPVAHTRGLYSSAAVTDGGVVGSSSATVADGLGVRGGVTLSTVTGPSTTTLANYVSPGTDTTSTYSPTTAGVPGFLPRYQDDPFWCSALFSYDPNDPSWNTSWSNLTSALPEGVPTVYSPKGTPAGAGASAVTNFLNNLPAAWRTQLIWAFYQEPEDNNLDLAWFKSQVSATADLVRPYGVKNAVHMQEWTINPFNNFSWGTEAYLLSMTDGIEDKIDYYSWSCYPAANNDGTANVARIADFMTNFPGMEWGITAAGLPVDPATSPLGGTNRQVRAANTITFAQAAVDAGSKGFGWFDWDEFNPGRDQLVIKDSLLMDAMVQIAQIEVPL